ncbi:DUF3592 domain-containing protein [Streptomyces sp. NPDC002262]|uniref:DUF3592 domain-containing protein n=1 Tax=Streptomyces sp. NPDC002262 TaxID=3154414 RepID=UPI00331D4924
MTITAGGPPPHDSPPELVLGFLTGGVIGVSLTSFIGGCVVGRPLLLVVGVALPAAHGLALLLAALPRRRREARTVPRTALARIEARETTRGKPTDVPVRFELSVVPDGAPAFRLALRQDVHVTELADLRPGAVVVVTYPPDRPWKARIVRRPTPEWEARAAAAHPDAAPGPVLRSDAEPGRAGGFLTLLGLLLGVAGALLLLRADLFGPRGSGSLPGLPGWDGFLRLWCAAWGAAALAGFGLSLAGLTKAQRTVRLTGRVVRVRQPRHGGTRRGGISVVVSYRDPVSGEEVTATNDGDGGETITAAWEGREIGVRHPRGRPHARRFSNSPEPPGRGLGAPSCAVVLAYAGLVALAAIEWGWPWALIGAGGPGALHAAVHLPGTVRARSTRLAALAAMDAVPGRVVAVLEDVGVDQEDGHTWTRTTPVVAFTTRAGEAVTAHCTEHLPEREDVYGREVTVHHLPSDPARFTLDPAAERRSEWLDVLVNVLVILVCGAAAAVGAALLRTG